MLLTSEAAALPLPAGGLAPAMCCDAGARTSCASFLSFAISPCADRSFASSSVLALAVERRLTSAADPGPRKLVRPCLFETTV